MGPGPFPLRSSGPAGPRKAPTGFVRNPASRPRHAGPPQFTASLCPDSALPQRPACLPTETCRRMPLLLLLFLILAPLAPRAQDLVGHGGPVRALAVLEGGGLASAGFDGAVILWDPASGKARRVLRWHEGALSALAALPGGGLASAGEEGRIALWSPLGLPGGAEQPLRVLEGHAGPVTALACLLYTSDAADD